MKRNTLTDILKKYGFLPTKPAYAPVRVQVKPQLPRKGR